MRDGEDESLGAAEEVLDAEIEGVVERVSVWRATDPLPPRREKVGDREEAAVEEVDALIELERAAVLESEV